MKNEDTKLPWVFLEEVGPCFRHDPLWYADIPVPFVVTDPRDEPISFKVTDPGDSDGAAR